MIRAFEGRSPQVPESAFVSEMAYLVGDVRLGDRATVWPFVCARGDFGPTVIGDETNVQDFTMLHEARLGDRVSVGHGAVVDRASVGDGSLVGISSSVLPGASVGSRCIVAAGSVVLQEQEIPDGHMAYGTPAETRALTDEQREHVEWVCDEYLDLRARYRSEGGLRSAGTVENRAPTEPAPQSSGEEREP